MVLERVWNPASVLALVVYEIYVRVNMRAVVLLSQCSVGYLCGVHSVLHSNIISARRKSAALPNSFKARRRGNMTDLCPESKDKVFNEMRAQHICLPHTHKCAYKTNARFISVSAQWQPGMRVIYSFTRFDT